MSWSFLFQLIKSDITNSEVRNLATGILQSNLPSKGEKIAVYRLIFNENNFT
ncbi:hypothetical protein [Metabacillus fastidiosus]|uniref:hypothetical protein n=1 Tax=Metabacillus fastidiosus TaxID=1458 RepID=UPI003D2E1B88